MGFPGNNSASAKIITAWDAALTLLIEHVGTSFHLPVYHPAILGTVIGGTYVLLKHKDRISDLTLKTARGAKKGAKRVLFVKEITGLEGLRN